MENRISNSFTNHCIIFNIKGILMSFYWFIIIFYNVPTTEIEIYIQKLVNYDHNWFKYSNWNNISAIYSCLASVGFWIKNCCMNLFLLSSNIFVTSFLLTKCDNISMGTGNTIVLLFSAEMLFKVCRYLSYNKIQLSQSTFQSR